MEVTPAKLIVLLCVFVLLPGLGLSQNDSLRRVYESQKGTEGELKALYKWAGTYLFTKGDSAVLLHRQLYELAVEHDSYSFQAKSLNSLGIAYGEIGRRDSALLTYQRAIDLYMDAADGPDSSRLTRTYGNMLIDAISATQFSSAKSLADSCMKYIPYGDTAARYAANEKIIYLMMKQRLYDDAIKFGKRNLKIAQDLDSPPKIAYSLKEIGNAFNNMEKYDSSVLYFKKAEELFANSPDKTGYAQILTFIGGNLMQMEDYANAKKYLQKSEATLIEVDPTSMCSNYSAQALTFYHLKMWDKALQYIEKIKQLDERVADATCLAKAYYTSSRVYHYMGQNDKAYEALLKSQSMQDSLRNEQNTQSIIALEKRLELKEKEKQLLVEKQRAQQEKNKRRRVTFGALALLLAGGLFYLWFSQRQKIKRRLVEKEKELALREKENLQKLSDTRTQFFTNISHELKTPLTLISGPIEDLYEQNSLPSADKEKLEIARRNSHTLMDMVNEILQLAKLETDVLPINPKPLHLDNFVKRQFTSFDSFAQSRDISLDYLSDAEEVSVNVDSDHLERIINNLVSNAIKYSEPDSTVSMKLMAKRKEMDQFHISIDVIDQGRGIPADQVPYIFERFYQARSSQDQAMGGVGIGLSLAKQLAELISGNLDLIRSDEKGSVFRLTFVAPEAIVQVSSTEPEVQYLPSLEEVKDSTILVVEDNQDMLSYIRGLLEGHCNVKTAKNGFEALQILQTEPDIDLVTSDVMMPKLDGFGLRERMLRLDRLKQIPFLFLTARSLEEDVMRGFQLGADDYIIKPFKSNELYARVHNLLSNNRERKKAAIEVGMLESKELSTLDRFENAVRTHLDKNHKLEYYAQELNISERQLRRIVKSETGLTPSELILELRLLKARLLLEKKQFSTVAEVMYQVGIESASYFSKKYTQRFGVRPSELLK